MLHSASSETGEKQYLTGCADFYVGEDLLNHKQTNRDMK